MFILNTEIVDSFFQRKGGIINKLKNRRLQIPSVTATLTSSRSNQPEAHVPVSEGNKFT